MTKHILVTGASGFIGSHVTEELIKEGFNVTILKRSFTDIWRIAPLMKKITAFNIDQIPLNEVFKKEGIDCVFHLSANYKKNHAYNDIEEMIKTNLTFSTQLVDTAANNGVELFVNCGSYFEYQPTLFPIDERSPRVPHNLYSATKLGFEVIIDYYAKNYKMKAATLMLFSPYGEKDNINKLIPMLITKALRNEVANLSEGYQKLDFTYVKDIASAFLKTLNSLNNLDDGHEFINIASGVPHSIRDIVSILQELSDFPLRVEWGQRDFTEYEISVANIEKAYRIIGWSPIHDIRSGLMNTLRYYEGESADESA